MICILITFYCVGILLFNRNCTSCKTDCAVWDKIRNRPPLNSCRVNSQLIASDKLVHSNHRITPYLIESEQAGCLTVQSDSKLGYKTWPLTLTSCSFPLHIRKQSKFKSAWQRKGNSRNNVQEPKSSIISQACFVILLNIFICILRTQSTRYVSWHCLAHCWVTGQCSNHGLNVTSTKRHHKINNML